jgi:hypothetical protein
VNISLYCSIFYTFLQWTLVLLRLDAVLQKIVLHNNYRIFMYKLFVQYIKLIDDNLSLLG